MQQLGQVPRAEQISVCRENSHNAQHVAESVPLIRMPPVFRADAGNPGSGDKIRIERVRTRQHTPLFRQWRSQSPVHAAQQTLDKGCVRCWYPPITQCLLSDEIGRQFRTVSCDEDRHSVVGAGVAIFVINVRAVFRYIGDNHTRAENLVMNFRK